MKHHLIVSSAYTGGKDSARGREILHAINLNLDNVTVSESHSPGHAEELSRRALRNGADSILVAAGDDMINEVVNGFFESGKPVAEKPHLGIIPTQESGNLRRLAGTSEHLMEAVGRIGMNEPRPLDLGRVTLGDGKSRYFANVASTGIQSALRKDCRRAQWLNAIENDLSFNWSVFKNKLVHKRFPLLVSIPGGPQHMRWDANCVAVCNGKAFDGITVAKEADSSDGFLDVIIIHDYTKAEFFNSLKQLRQENSLELEEGVSKIHTRAIVLSCDDPERKVPVDIDGIYAGLLPARFDIIPAAAMLF